MNGRRVPGTAAKGFNTFAIKSGSDVAASATSGIVAEDTQHDRRLVVVDLVLAGPPRDRTIAVRQATGSLPLRELSGKPAACLGCEVREVERADQATDADRDLARAPVVDGYKLTAAEAQHFPDLGQLRLRACNAIEALHDHDVEATVNSAGDQILKTGPAMDRGTRKRSIRKGFDDTMAFTLAPAAAQRLLIFNRARVLQVG
ncbi:hypothetical protein OZ411_40080 [Bradyrhizobium sp. Arg237L]|uniref:hypothetical protein n=1 Tax=Bradyrhizobium sp. Arg237L TaxID=3003352 RepID=UPI00249E5D55|nr:hypothetical protein [Bradyrhizobium sp. Arg237L]MDI4238994.1 hypothetical protein [Bradyrhizobium sp. Arg237L]